MKLNVNIQTSIEQSGYWEGEEPNKKWVTIYLNEKDRNNQAQIINFAISGFDYRGSLYELEQVVSEWIKKKMHEQVELDAKEAHMEIEKKIVREPVKAPKK
ncbi:MAG: hypothetical protein MOGMAGMI_01830 [Candidatus Omnitrophica bacterium]|nr:hypothetical protein [Candidatus Omnitrophota bacterium]